MAYQPLHWQANSVNIFELKDSGWKWPFLDYSKPKKKEELLGVP